MPVRSCSFVAGVVVVLASSSFAADGVDLIAPGAKVEKLADGFIFTEGPAANARGDVYFSDINNERIHVWSTDGKLGTFRENSGKANGLYFDEQGNLIACEGGSRRVTSTSPDGEVTVIVDSYNGKKLNSPNDLWIDAKGGIYFTDPRYGKRDDLEQDGEHVYYIPPGGGELRRVVDNMTRPNGIIGTADGKTLYVTDEGGDKVFAYRIDEDGSLADQRLVASEGSDGMTLDEKGLLYITNGAVKVYDPSATDKKLLEIQADEGAANVTFGGNDRRTLFITARKGLYAIQMNVAGVKPVVAE